MPPQHQNPKPERTARAPYNFVPVPERVLAFRQEDDHPFRPQIDYNSRRATGWIEVELETVTPIYVRGPLSLDDYRTMERQEADPNDQTPHLDKIRNRPEFFHTGDPLRPAIPGSSLRGMLRTLVEILGHGKLQPVSDLALVYRSIADEWYRQQLMFEEPHQRNHFTPLFRGGYIRESGGEWYIQPAQEINGATYARISHGRLNEVQNQLQGWRGCKNARLIYIQPGPLDFQKVRGGFIHIRYIKVQQAAASNGRGLIEAVLATSGKMNSKRSEAVIFPPDESKSDPDDWFPISDELVGIYQNQITDEQKRLLGPDGALRDHQPIFYLLDSRGHLVFFWGHTQMFRLPYRFSPQEMLHPVHSDDSLIDLAEAMFGTVRGNESGQAGRVFVTDAMLQPNQADVFLSDEAIIPKILSGPKPTTVQHYLVQDKPDDRRSIRTYRDGLRKTTLRGHKLYWHKRHVDRRTFEEPDQVNRARDTQHTQIKPVREGVRFRFRVYFQNLMLPELGLLWWALALPLKADDRPDYCHKIGMGKPLGLGTVRLTPALYLVNAKQRYDTLFAEQDDNLRWGEGLASERDTERILEIALNDFEDLVRSIQPGTLGDDDFEELPRIQMLLKMLQWPGPDNELTRYMEIERPDPRAKRGKRNEYRDRPVLPDPEHVD